MNGRRLWALLGAVAVAAAAVGLWLFAPWKAFTDTAVDEALPTAGAARVSPAAAWPPAGAAGGTPSAGAAGGTPSAGAAAPGPVELASGSFRSGEHTTTGAARLVRLPDGSTVLRLENLSTSDGPDVRVYLSAEPAAVSRLDSLGDGALELDRLKGNLGNQNYTVPAGTDLSRFRSAVLWCHRFSVGFGAADLTPRAG
ncbi:DM13 domain-containing protein [Kitasatospora terrestris]|uniref:DM13 domain-containing protein n=1 Tax=Kitasatospora terrestris TaxID=258051 RepID=A0ABP9EK06_9ACTN